MVRSFRRGAWREGKVYVDNYFLGARFRAHDAISVVCGLFRDKQRLPLSNAERHTREPRRRIARG